MRRWRILVGLAVLSFAVVGCAKEAKPDPTWAAVSAECQEAMKTYSGFGAKTVVTKVDGNCEEFEFRPVSGPQPWQQFQEVTYYPSPSSGQPAKPVTDTRRVDGEPEADEVYVTDVIEYDPWRDPVVGDLDPQGRPIKGVETIGMRYLPLYRWGCQSPSDPEIELRCKLMLSVNTRVEQSTEISHELGISFGVGDTSNGLGGGVEGRLEKTEKQVLSTWVEDNYPATVSHDADRSGEDSRWYVAELRDYRTHLVRDVYLCKKYRKTGLGFTRYRLYCQLVGLQYQRIEAVEFYNILTTSLTKLRERIASKFPGIIITPEAQALLDELEQVSNDVEPNNPPMPKEITCETNVDCQSRKAGVEVTASAMSKFGLSVSIGGGQEKTVSLTGSGGLSVTTESKISSQQVHSLEFEAKGPAGRVVDMSYRRSDLHTGKSAGSYYVN